MTSGQPRHNKGLITTLRRRLRGLLDRPARPATREDLWRALRDVIERHNDPQFSRLEAPPRGYLPLTRKDLAYYLNEIELLLQSVGSRDTPEQRENESVQTTVMPGECETWSLGQRAVHPIALDFENLTPQLIEGAYLSVNSWRADSLEGLLRMALGSVGSGDGPRAFAIYGFCCRHAQHGPAPGEDRNRLDVLDPLRFFHGFGYGLCGFRANTFAILCALAGMRCRVWNIGVHTFPEVMIDGKWCILDPDAEMWFRDRAGNLIGFEELRRDPGFYFGRVRMTPWYETRRSDLQDALNQSNCGQVVAQGYDLLERLKANPLTMGLRLLPREKMTFVYSASSPWRSTPRIYPVFSPPLNLAHLVSRIDVGCTLACIASSGLVGFERSGLEIETNDATLEIDLKQPYPILDSVIACTSQDPAVLSGIQIAVMRGGILRTVESCKDKEGQRVYRLRRALMGSAAAEETRVRMLFKRVGRLSSIRVESTYQASPLMLPVFLPGDNNLSLIANPSAEPAAVRVELRYEMGISHPSTTPTALSPKNGALLTFGEPIEWSTPLADEALNYRFRIRSVDSELPLAPQFDHVTSGPRWSIPAEDWNLLQVGSAYAWEVCSVDSLGRPVSEWSRPAHFQVSP